MSPEMVIAITIGGFILLLALGVEVAIALSAICIIGFVFIINQPITQFGWCAFTILNSFVLTAVPFFIFMGMMLANTGVVSSLFEAAEKWLGGLPGGLACATIGAEALFGAMSGSSIAAAATFGTIALPEMERKGYSPKLALGSTVVGGTLAVLIPPSIILVIYGGWWQVSVVRLFAAALIPGIMLAVLMLLSVVVRVKLNPALAPKSPAFTWKERILAIRDLLPWVGVIGAVLGSIFGGIMTTTESAALGAGLSVVVAAAYRKLTYASLKESVLTTVKICGMLGLIIVAADAFNFVVNKGGVADVFRVLFEQLELNKYEAIVLIYIMYFILGMFIEDVSMLLITMPFIMPVVHHFGFNLLWFGVVYVITAEVALVTPPFGLNLFALKGVAPKYELTEIAASAVYFLIPLVIALALLTIWPQIALWLPMKMFTY